MRSDSASGRKHLAQTFLSMAVLALMLGLLSWSGPSGSFRADSGLFQSPLPEDKGKEKEVAPSSWIWSHEGGTRQFGSVRVKLPPGFTNQGGANVIGDMLVAAFFVDDLTGWRLLQGTEMALGIWPENDQTDFQKPIEIRVTLDAAKLTQGIEDRLALMVYDPDTKKWEQLPSQFHKATLEIVASVQSFKPVPKNFPDWGGRTFLGVFEPISTSAPKRAATSTSTPTSTPTTQGSATPGPTATRTPASLRIPTYTPYPTYTTYPTWTPYPTVKLLPSPTPTSRPTEQAELTLSRAMPIAASEEEDTAPKTWIYALILGAVIVAVTVTLLLYLILRRTGSKEKR